jgi:hypothetical protein
MDAHFDLVHSTIAVLAIERELLLERLAAHAGPEGIVLTGESRSTAPMCSPLCLR